VSKLLVTRALAAIAAVDAKLIAQRLMGWTDGRVRPTAAGFLQLIAAQSEDEHKLRGGQPYPFFLAHQLQGDPAALGELGDWQVEWKYDGIRAQLVRRGGQNYLWSRGEDLITERFPGAGGLSLPEGTVVDGEVLIWTDAKDSPGAVRRPAEAHRPQDLVAKLLAELPAVLLAYDLLELDGVDLRALPQHERRALLETLVTGAAKPQLRISPLVTADTWDDLGKLRAESRARGVEGMMLKARNAQYGVGRTKDVGTWWKWKIDPYAVDAVLIYAQPGSGRRASLYTDYTFAVWDGEGERAQAGALRESLFRPDRCRDRQVDNAIRKTTVEKFGPVRSVKPTMVFEIGFEGIALSPRHKAGIAVRFPRILRRRDDKTGRGGGYARYPERPAGSGGP
jgi:DNA ligase-1